MPRLSGDDAEGDGLAPEEWKRELLGTLPVQPTHPLTTQDPHTMTLTNTIPRIDHPFTHPPTDLMPRGLRSLFQNSVEPLLSEVMLKRQRLAYMASSAEDIQGDIDDCVAEIAKARRRWRGRASARRATPRRRRSCRHARRSWWPWGRS